MSFDPYASPKFQTEPATVAHPQNLRQSGFGIASIIISVFVGIVLFVMIAYAGYVEMSDPGSVDETAPLAMILGFAIMGGIGMAFLGMTLGMIGCVFPDKSKIASIIGIVFNLLIVLSVCGLMGLGMAVSP